MAYEKQTWNTGDLITEEKLNHIEDGIASNGGIKVYNATFSESTESYEINMSEDEFNDIVQNKTYCLVKYDGEEGEYVMPLVWVNGDSLNKELRFGGITCTTKLGTVTIETVGLAVYIKKDGGMRCNFSSAYLEPKNS